MTPFQRADAGRGKMCFQGPGGLYCLIKGTEGANAARPYAKDNRTSRQFKPVMHILSELFLHFPSILILFSLCMCVKYFICNILVMMQLLQKLHMDGIDWFLNMAKLKAEGLHTIYSFRLESVF